MTEPSPGAEKRSGRPFVRAVHVAPRLRMAIIVAGAASTLLLTYLAVRGIDLSAAWRAARTSQMLWLAPSLLCLGAAVFLRAVRWRYLFAPSTRPPLGAVAGAYLVGLFFNSILPLRAGEAARIVALSRRGGSRAEITATVVIERVFDVLSLLVLLFVLEPWLPHRPSIHVAALVALGFGLPLLGLIVALAAFGDRVLHLLFLPLRVVPSLPRARIEGIASRFGRGLASIRGLRGGATVGALTILSWLVMGLSFWLLSLAFQLPRSPLIGILVVIATNLAQVLPSTPAAVGIFEAATLVALGFYRANPSVALSYAIVLHVVNLVPYLVLGPLALRRNPVVALRAPRRQKSEVHV